MSNCAEGEPLCFKLKYKGIENFLRRVAFNLGNSPSQTDVKIISCIPIDVTDLQQRIICLEKQLKEKQCCNKPKTVNDALVYPATTAFDKQSTKEYCTTSPRPQTPTLEKNDSKFVIYQSPRSTAKEIIENVYKDNEVNEENISKKETGDNECLINKRKKKKVKKVFKNNHLVYHAHTSSPVKLNPLYKTNAPKTAKEPFNRSYLTNMVYKQYQPAVVNESTDVLSQFSAPICRDLNSRVPNMAHEYETDICSCCHGNFKNVDDHIKQHYSLDNRRNFFSRNDNSPYEPFYDSSLYDIIPVKETPKIRKQTEHFQKVNEVYNNMEMSSCPDVKFKRRVIQNKLRKEISKDKKPGIKPHERQTRGLIQMNGESLASCYVDCGKIYAKKSNYQRPTMRSKKCALDSATTSKETNIQPATKIETKPTNTNNEECLNEIKSILQNVLKEIKTNSKIKRETAKSSNGKKKDAFVQNTSHNSNIDATSRFMNSFTYSPYNMASCYPPHNPYSPLPFQAVRCVHPIMVQNPPHIYTGHLKPTINSQGSTQTPKQNKLNTTSTNTDNNMNTSIKDNETEKLIQEIFKSLTLNLDSEDSQLKSDDFIYRPTGVANVQDKHMNNENISEEISNKNIRLCLSASANDTNPSTITDKIMQKEFHNNKENTTGLNKLTEIVEKESHRELSLTEVSSETDSNVSTASSEYKPQKKEKPKSLISKIIKSVKFIKNRKSGIKDEDKKTKLNLKQMHNEDDSEVSSVSDDYTTVYSGESVKHINPVQHQIPSQTNKQVYYERCPKYSCNKLRYYQKPNMEQEYRRHWAENLSFRNSPKDIHTSDGPMTNRYSSGRKHSIPYWQNVEARNASLNYNNASTSNTKPKENADRNNFKTHYVKDKVVIPRVRSQNKNTALTWLKKYKCGMQACGKEWTKMLLES